MIEDDWLMVTESDLGCFDTKRKSFTAEVREISPLETVERVGVI
jgi:hypothetical protein